MKIKILISLMFVVAASKTASGSEFDDDFDPETLVSVPVKRLHSRHRRYVAPGASWQTFYGIEIVWPDKDLKFNLIVSYNMDYLFGGSIALLSRIAANNAARNASIVVFDNTRTALNAAAALQAAVGRKKRSFDQGQDPNGSLFMLSSRKKRAAAGLPEEPDMSNILVRSLADDQVSIFEKIEESLDQAGIPGRQCVLKTICELRETPINEWSLIGEAIYNIFMPKRDLSIGLEAMEDYIKAEDIGANHGECWSFYPQCPFSIFNLIPDIYTKDDEVQVSFDDLVGGSGFSNKNEDEINKKMDDEIKKFGDNVKEFKVDMNIGKP